MERSEYQSIYELETTYWWYRVLHELVLRQIDRLAQSRRLNVLDAGCGTGRLLELLSCFGNAEGFDFSDDAVRFCRMRGVPAKKDDLNTWRGKPESLDGIVSMDALYHESIPDDRIVLKRFFEALKPGGFLILNLVAFESLRRGHDDVIHIRERCRKPDYLRRLRDAGFEPVLATYRMPILALFIWLRKGFGLRGNMESDLKPIHPILNAMLLGMGRIENRLIDMGIPMPFGTSLFVVVKKPMGKNI
jgi:SAM-dependent methyltransferase